MKKLLFLATMAFGLLNLQFATAEELKTTPDTKKCSELPAMYMTPETPWSQLDKYSLLHGDDPNCEIRVATFAEGSKCIPEGFNGGAQKILVRAKDPKDGYIKTVVCSRDGMRDSKYWGLENSCAWDLWFCIWTDHEWDAPIKKDWF